MDLEARLKEFAAALAANASQSFLAERLVVDVDGARGDRDAALAWLSSPKRGAPSFTLVGVKRNVTFVDWAWPGVGAGVGVISWDQDGRVVHAAIQVRKRGLSA